VAAGPRLLSGGTGPEARVVREVGRWRRGGRALGTSGKTGQRATGEGGTVHEPMRSAAGQHGV
jgi:hypothetical protein